MSKQKPDLDLKFYFDLFNSRYFKFSKKKMSTLLGIEWGDLREHKAIGVNWSYRTLYAPKGTPKQDKYKIIICRRIKNLPIIWRGTLLHEMAHFKLQGKDKSRLPCGSRMFKAEMKRLANIGAFNGLW